MKNDEFHVLKVSHMRINISIVILLPKDLMSVQGYIRRPFTQWASHICDFECARINNANSYHMFCIGWPIALFIALVEWCYSGFYDKWWLQCVSFDRKGMWSFPSRWWMLYLLHHSYVI